MRRILTIDGGGHQGDVSCFFSCHHRRLDLETELANYFDLVVGTSTGGIIALGLGLGFSAEEIAAFDEELGGKVFADSNTVWRTLRQLLFSKHSDQPLKKRSNQSSGKESLGKAQIGLLFPR